MQSIHSNCSKEIPILLVGNKHDLPNPAITEQQGIEMAEKYKAGYIETSALDGHNIEAMLNKIMKLCYDSKFPAGSAQEETPVPVQP